MSDTHDDHGHDGHERGGHEIDRMPNARLFSLLFGFSLLTLVACIGVVQLFNFQVSSLEASRAEQGSFRRHAYEEEMQALVSGWGEVSIAELDEKATVTKRYYMPVANARKVVLDDPKRLKAAKAPGGWKTSDAQAPQPVGREPSVPGAPAPTPPGPLGAVVPAGGAKVPAGDVPAPNPAVEPEPAAKPEPAAPN